MLEFLNKADLPTKYPDALHALQNGVHEFIKVGICTISASQMALALRECTHPIQLDVRDPKDADAQRAIATHAETMRRGGWLPRDKLDFGLLNGLLYFANGTHRGSAQALSGKTLTWTVDIHPCASEDEFRALFYKFDTNVRVRTLHQIAKVAGLAKGNDIPEKIRATLLKAMTPIIQEFRPGRNDASYLGNVVDYRLELAHSYIKEAEAYNRCIQGADRTLLPKLLSMGVMAVALVTLRHQKITAVKFWTGVAEDDGLSKNDPRRVLNRDLTARKLNSGPANQSQVVPANAWNSYFNGEDRCIIRAGKKSIVRIAGTPYDGE